MSAFSPFISSLIGMVFDSLLLVTHAVLTETQLLGAFSDLNLRSSVHLFCSVQKFFGKTPTCACCPSTPCLLGKEYVGLYNKGTLAEQNESSNYESLRWHRKTRQHILCNCSGLAAAHQIGEEAPVLRRRKSICTQERVELDGAHQTAKKGYKEYLGGKCL